ncbi:hypothetical protein [Pseudoalteromonas rubra]|uniref:Uncharacterized protein n=1 Tax=Pseudoalteromonas rubra TaxID=43658 RepID=A0A5S3X752_9GAMM|nr:hypothetical protein [Pseudoalteromonas rubra]TMP39553.1 hypothetical protein CWB98_02900 [Pseudoalteromonas rubra]
MFSKFRQALAGMFSYKPKSWAAQHFEYSQQSNLRCAPCFKIMANQDGSLTQAWLSGELTTPHKTVDINKNLFEARNYDWRKDPDNPP